MKKAMCLLLALSLLLTALPLSVLAEDGWENWEDWEIWDGGSDLGWNDADAEEEEEAEEEAKEEAEADYDHEKDD